MTNKNLEINQIKTEIETHLEFIKNNLTEYKLELRSWLIFENDEYLKQYRPKDGQYYWPCSSCKKGLNISLKLNLHLKESNCVDCELTNWGIEELLNNSIDHFDYIKERIEKEEFKKNNWKIVHFVKIDNEVWTKKVKECQNGAVTEKIVAPEPKRKDKVELVDKLLKEGKIDEIISKKQWDKLETNK